MDKKEISDALDLGRLERVSAGMAAYEGKYGAREGAVRYLRDRGMLAGDGMDLDERIVNMAIYDGRPLRPHGSPELIARRDRLWRARMESLFGDAWMDHARRKPGDPEAVEALLSDALRTGHRKELPPCLHEEYDRRAEAMP